MLLSLPIPGQLILRSGTRADYEALARFHYLQPRPATFARIWTIAYSAATPPCPQRVIAVAVMSHPSLRSFARERALNLVGMDAESLARFVNQQVRTISRIIVHPQFRGLGLASRLARHCCRQNPTRHTECHARMGRAHPFLSKAGMTLMEPAPGDDQTPLYYLHTKEPESLNPDPRRNPWN